MTVLSDLELNEAGPEFEVVIRRLADSLIYGGNDSQFVGSGLSYAHSRPFEDGDSIKNIDWRVSARKDRYYVKEYEALKQMPVYLIMDTSASMSFSSSPQSKYALALQTAGALALSFLKQMNPVGIVGAGERQLFYKPCFSASRIFQWLNDLRYHNYSEKTGICRRLEELPIFIKQRSLVVILSDLHEAGAVDSLLRLNLEHDLIVLQMRDPAEEQRLQAGFMRTREAESEQSFVAHGRSRFEIDSSQQTLSNHGVDHLILRTGEDFSMPLRRFLSERGKGGRS